MKRLAVRENDRTSVRISMSDRSRINQLRMKIGGYGHQVVTLALDALEKQLKEGDSDRTSEEVAA